MTTLHTENVEKQCKTCVVMQARCGPQELQRPTRRLRARFRARCRRTDQRRRHAEFRIISCSGAYITALESAGCIEVDSSFVQLLHLPVTMRVPRDEAIPLWLEAEEGATRRAHGRRPILRLRAFVASRASLLVLGIHREGHGLGAPLFRECWFRKCQDQQALAPHPPPAPEAEAHAGAGAGGSRGTTAAAGGVSATPGSPGSPAVPRPGPGPSPTPPPTPKSSSSESKFRSSSPAILSVSESGFAPVASYSSPSPVGGSKASSDVSSSVSDSTDSSSPSTFRADVSGCRGR